MNIDYQLTSVKTHVKNALNRLYSEDTFLFERNNGDGVCERCLVFRFAMYLQNEYPNLFVDCDFNSSATRDIDGDTNEILEVRDNSGKLLVNQDGTSKKRFVDIIIHERDFTKPNDFICFEIKKWNNNKDIAVQEDYEKLMALTRNYSYTYGIHLTFGRTKENTCWTVFYDGDFISEEHEVQIFDEQEH